MVQYPHDGPSWITPTLSKKRTKGMKVVAACDILLDAVEASGRVGRDVVVGSGAKTWRAATAVRGLLGDHGRVQAFDARENYRYFRRRGWEPVLENGDANERTAFAETKRRRTFARRSVVGEHGGDVRHLPRPERLDDIAKKAHGLAKIFEAGATKMGFHGPANPYFDTVTLKCPSGADAVVASCAKAKSTSVS